MGFVTVNHSLNQAYFVEKAVFEKITKKAISMSKLTKLVSFNVEVLKGKNDYKIEMTVNIKADSTYKESLFELQNNIEYLSLNLIDSKPENISIIIEGEF